MVLDRIRRIPFIKLIRLKSFGLFALRFLGIRMMIELFMGYRDLFGCNAYIIQGIKDIIL
jgi:hypothetical protein